MSGGHTHDLDGDPVVARRLVWVVVVITTVAAVAMVVWWPRDEVPPLNPGTPTPELVDATVLSVRDELCPGTEPGEVADCRVAEMAIESGPEAGTTFPLRLLAIDYSLPELQVGDRVVLARLSFVLPEYRYTFYDFQRSTPLLVLVVLFVVAVAALGRWQGVRAVLGIGLSFAVLLVFMLPALLLGAPALPVALAATVIIAVAALYLAHGMSTATTVALLGTFVSLAAIVALGWIFVEATTLTGLSNEDARVLQITAEGIDLRGLLLAGIVVGALGVLDDVTVTQVSAVAELRRADPGMSRRDLYRSGIRIGRDHIASTVNTLVLAYAGASLPLLLLFVQGGQSWLRIGASEVVAIEIVRALVGSIGLVLAVPVTTALAARVAVSSFDAEHDGHGALDGPDGHGRDVPRDDPPPDGGGWEAFSPRDG